MKLFLVLSAFCILLASVEAVTFIPNEDVMIRGVDGELRTLWGEHNFYTDTSSFGRVLTYNNGTFYVGGGYARTS